MKSLSCKSMGSMDCSAVVTGKNAAEVKKKAWEHAAKVHPQVLAKMSSRDKAGMNKMMDKLIA